MESLLIASIDWNLAKHLTLLTNTQGKMKGILKIGLLVLTLLGLGASLCGRRRSILLSARGLTFPCRSTEDIYREAGKLKPRNIIITRAQMLHDDVFAALPRLKPGVPFTLAKANLKSKAIEAELIPFPNWDLQRIGHCEALQSVVDLFLDSESILWVLDEGIINSLTKPQPICAPKVVGIDAKTGKVLQIVNLSSVVVENSRLQYIVANNKGPDGNVRLFITDAGARAVLVVDPWNGLSRRVSLPPPPSIKLSSPGETSSCRLPAYSLASAKSPVAASTFSVDPNYSMTSTSSEECVPTTALYAALVNRGGRKILVLSALGDPILYGLTVDEAEELKEIGMKPRGKDIVFLGTDGYLTLFFRYVGQTQIMSWNANTPFTAKEMSVAAGSQWNGPETSIPSQVLVGDIALWSLDAPLRQFLEERVGSIGSTTKLHQLGADDEDC